MIETLSYLLRNRVKAKPFSHSWLRLWAKRAVNLGGLLRILYRSARLSGRAANVGRLCFFGKLELNGAASRLTIGRECVIGNHVHLALHDEIRLGDNVIINDGCMLLTASHSLDSPDWHHVRGPIVIEDRAWIATRAMILPGVRIGYAAVVGAGAVVTKDVPPYHVVAGNPARTVKQRPAIEFSYSAPRFLAPIEAWVGLPR